MNKHTPGPWELKIHSPTYVEEKTKFWITNKGLQDCFVATWESFDGYNHHRMEADARLIAAAPDLLEALCKLAELYDAMGAPRGPCRIIADAAIAKATGE